MPHAVRQGHVEDGLPREDRGEGGVHLKHARQLLAPELDGCSGGATSFAREVVAIGGVVGLPFSCT